MVLPSVIDIDNSIKPVQRNHRMTLGHVETNGSYVPLRDLFKGFFEISNIYSQIILHMSALKESDLMTNFLQGNVWKTKTNDFDCNKVVIPYNLYFDDFEPDNALGSHKNAILLQQPS